MAYEVMILCHLHMPLYFLGTFTEYPYLGRTAAVLPPTPDNIRLNGADLSWGAVSNVAYYAIYKDNGKERKADLVGITQGTSFKLSEKGVYFVTSLFKNNAESEISETVSY